MTKAEKLWGGRFQAATDKQVEAFTASIPFDNRLYNYDIEGSIAHAKMLSKQGIISKSEGRIIVKGLKEIAREIESGNFVFQEDDEDIHMAIEKALIARVGETGAKLHTARSRNDQVALDMRLYVRAEITQIIDMIREAKETLVKISRQELRTAMPGYTHLRKAQPVLLAHYLMAYFDMLDRDEERLQECRVRTNVMPLGVAALAGTGLSIDRAYTARLLNFPSLSQNSMDTVSDRDFTIEFASCSALIMMHLSRFSEDLIIWSTEEFAYIEIDDAFTTGSSIMPQKKNPDVAELIRGKTARVYGHLVALLTLLKGLPMTYNRDLQEDKEPVFDTADTVKACLRIFTALLNHLAFNREKMKSDAGSGFATATDLAEYLVKKGVPFRVAHRSVGRLVAYCVRQGKDLPSLTMEEFRTFSEKFDTDVYEYITVENSIKVRSAIGGTAEKAVWKRIEHLPKTTKRP